jgi:hypothetical protein
MSFRFQKLQSRHAHTYIHQSSKKLEIWSKIIKGEGTQEKLNQWNLIIKEHALELNIYKTVMV